MTTSTTPFVRLRMQDAAPTSDPFGPGGGDALVAHLPAGRRYRREDCADGSVKMWMLPAGATSDSREPLSAREIQRRNAAFWGDRNATR